LHAVTLGGESLGGALALGASIDLKDRVDKVVAFNSYDYPGGLERGNLFARFIVSAIRMPGLGPVFGRMENRLTLRGVMRGGVVDKGKLATEFLAELRKSGRRKGYPRVARAIYRSLKGFQQARERYPQVSAPVTLVYSERDWSRPKERDHVAGLLADVHRVTLPNTGHFSALEYPNAMTRILLEARR
jgi:pimeloyl-ACP methyl ester carboxylesterase